MSALTKELNKGTPTRGERGERGRGRGSGPGRAQDSPSKLSIANSPGESLLFTLQALIGHTVRVQVKTGVVYTGVFCTANATAKDLDLVLRYARIAEAEPGSKGPAQQPPIKTLKIHSSDLVQLTAVDVGLAPDDLAPPAARDPDAFSTDTEISRSRAGTEGRELQRWVPSEGDPADALETLPTAGRGSVGGRRSSGGGWNQFQVNQDKFGVTTSFDENIYTTKMDPTRSKYSQADAARLAAEIEKKAKESGTTNAHLAEERGMELDEEVDEETLYSSVNRPTAAASQQEATTTAPTPQPGQEGPPARANGRAMENGDSDEPSSNSNSLSGTTGSGGVSSAASRAEGGRPRSQPIAVDARREHNKLRMQLTQSGSRASTSPYGTPKSLSRSPLASPLVGNASQVAALNLEPGTAKFEPSVRKDFQAFKLQHRSSGGASEAGEPTSSLQAEPSSSGASTATDDASRRKDATTSATTSRPGSAGTRGSKAQAPEPPGAAPGLPNKPGPKLTQGPPRPAGGRPGPAAGPSAAVSSAAPSTPSSSTQAPRPGTATPQLTPALSGSSAGGASAAPSTGGKALNPFAKSFSFNPNAQTFVPVAGTSTRPSTAASTPSEGSFRAAAHTTPSTSDARPGTSIGPSHSAGGPPRMSRAASTATAGSQGSDGLSQGNNHPRAGRGGGAAPKHPPMIVGQNAMSPSEMKSNRGPGGPVPMSVMASQQQQQQQQHQQHQMMAQAQRMGGHNPWMGTPTAYLQPRGPIMALNSGSPQQQQQQQQFLYLARPTPAGMSLPGPMPMQPGMSPPNGSFMVPSGPMAPIPVMYAPGMQMPGGAMGQPNGIMRPGMFPASHFPIPMGSIPGSLPMTPGMQMGMGMPASGDMLMPGPEGMRRGGGPNTPHGHQLSGR